MFDWLHLLYCYRIVLLISGENNRRKHLAPLLYQNFLVPANPEAVSVHPDCLKSSL